MTKSDNYLRKCVETYGTQCEYCGKCSSKEEVDVMSRALCIDNQFEFLRNNKEWAIGYITQYLLNIGDD